MRNENNLTNKELWRVPFFVSVRRASKILRLDTRAIDKLIREDKLQYLETGTGKYKVRLEVSMPKPDALKLLGATRQLSEIAG